MEAIGRKLLDELEEIRVANSGILKAEDVVTYARDTKTALHSQFTWSDKKAAHEYRLEEARRLIRVVVTVLDGEQDPIRAYVSLRTDRIRDGGGYRMLVDVLEDAEMRAQLLAESLADLGAWEEKYRRLEELAPIFEAAKKVRRNK